MRLSPKGFDPGAAHTDSRHAARLVQILVSGGDRRIQLDAAGRNQYHASAAPIDALAYGSSTISSISDHAFAALLRRWRGRFDRPMSAAAYARGLDAIRAGLARYFGTDDRTAIIFSASGTDLEYVALAAACDGRPLTAILLGRDEVGSGCAHSAAGRFFAEETALGARVVVQTAIDPAFAGTELIDVPVRDEAGFPRASAMVAEELSRHVEHAAAAGRRAIVHVVHGSKSGLTLPALAEVERLVAAHGDAMRVVVDACQLRITPEGVRRYLDLGCIVMLTGSKFAGGPPFSGFALVPPRIRADAKALPPGLRRISYRAEWPSDWPGADRLDAQGNFGLLLRLEAALVEIERFAAVPADRVAAVSARFCEQLVTMAERLGVAEVPGAGGVSCLATQTLQTIDLSARWRDCDFDAARALHAYIAQHARRDTGREIRLGQPVRTHRLPDGRSAGTLRLSLSMPLISDLADLPPAALDARLANDMVLIEQAIATAADVTLDRKAPVALA